MRMYRVDYIDYRKFFQSAGVFESHKFKKMYRETVRHTFLMVI